MAGTATPWVDPVLPEVPARKWVLSPWQVRFLMAKVVRRKHAFRKKGSTTNDSLWAIPS
jgi:hypothetical protein